jgi:outer membrane lipoprotein-sorting protein
MKPTLFFLALVLAVGTLRADDLQAALSRMDSAAAEFHGMAADMTMVVHTAILDDNTTENGNVKMQKGKHGTEALIEFTGTKDQRSVGFMDKTVQIYFPKLNLVNIYKVGKKANLLDQYLLLGFGTSGKDLTKGYEIQVGGTEQVNGGPATRLVLTPKDAAMKEQINKAEIWLPTGSGYPVQQKFSFPSGNYRLVTYSNFKLNPALGSLKLQTPKGAKVEYPQ